MAPVKLQEVQVYEKASKQRVQEGSQAAHALPVLYFPAGQELIQAPLVPLANMYPVLQATQLVAEVVHVEQETSHEIQLLSSPTTCPLGHAARHRVLPSAK